MNLRLEYDETDQDTRVRSSGVCGPRHKGAAFTKVETDSDLDETRYLLGSAFHFIYNFDAMTFTSITSWRSYNSRNPQEKDGSAGRLYSFNDLNAEKNKQFSQEFRLNGDIGSSFRWTAGLNYFCEHAKQNSGITLTTLSLDKLIAEREIGLPYAALSPGQPLDIAFAFPTETRIDRAGNYDPSGELSWTGRWRPSW